MDLHTLSFEPLGVFSGNDNFHIVQEGNKICSADGLTLFETVHKKNLLLIPTYRGHYSSNRRKHIVLSWRRTATIPQALRLTFRLWDIVMETSLIDRNKTALKITGLMLKTLKLSLEIRDFSHFWSAFNKSGTRLTESLIWCSHILEIFSRIMK